MNTAGERERERESWCFCTGAVKVLDVFYYQGGGRRQKVCVQSIGACEDGRGQTA